MTPPDGSSLLTDLRRMCESTKPDETPVLYTLGQLRAMLDTPVIAHNPDRAQIALLGALTTEQAKTEPEKRDPDPTAPGAPGERVERRG